MLLAGSNWWVLLVGWDLEDMMDGSSDKMNIRCVVSRAILLFDLRVHLLSDLR